MLAWPGDAEADGVAVTVSAALLLGAVFAGDSVWTAVAALLVAGGWGALALLGRAPSPGGGVVLGGSAAGARRLERPLDLPGPSRPTSPGPS